MSAFNPIMSSAHLFSVQKQSYKRDRERRGEETESEGDCRTGIDNKANTRKEAARKAGQCNSIELLCSLLFEVANYFWSSLLDLVTDRMPFLAALCPLALIRKMK